KKTRFTLRLRIPGWARNQPVPSDLYEYAHELKETPSVKVNDEPVGVTAPKGYLSLRRLWQKGDSVQLDLPMPVRRVVANEKVRADRGRVALERGPLVYCAEWPDNPGGKIRNVLLPDDAPLTAEFQPGLLNGVEVIRGKSLSVSRDASGA